jgi:nitrogen-specific signal transduction histidine kinase
MSKIYDSLRKAEKERLEASNGRLSLQILDPEEITVDQGAVLDSTPEKMDTLKPLAELAEEGPLDIQSAAPGSPLFVELANHFKTTLRSIKNLAEFSQGRFRDSEFEGNFIRMVCEYVDRANSGIDCFFDYLKIRSPFRKENTVHTILEEILNNNEKRFKDRKIRITQKQYARSLPETSVPDEVLRYALNWIVQYASSSISLNGDIEFLTRSINIQEARDQFPSFLKKENKYIEILIVFAVQEKQNKPPGTNLGMQALYGENNNSFILLLVDEIVKANRGIMRIEADYKRHLTQVSLILPVERRKLFYYGSVTR